MADEQTERDDGGGRSQRRDETLSVTDNRTGESYEVEIEDGTVKAMDFRQIKVSEDDFGLMTYDPAFTNTASVRSSVCYIDGEAGVLEYRGYTIEELCEKSSYLEVAYLLIYGELPTQEQLDEWIFEITHHTFVHENIKKFVEGFRYDAHPMGMLLATAGALSTFYPDAKNIDDEMERHMAAVRLIAKMPTLAAFAYRHNLGLPYVYPDNDLSYPGNFLSMMFKMTEAQVRARPAARARPRRPLDPARRPRAELLDERGARGRLVPGGSVLGGGRRRGRALRPAPRRRERGRCCACSSTSRSVDNIPDFLERVKSKRREADGLRAPGLQELRPARRDHQGARGRGLRGHRARTRSSTSPSELEKRALDDEYFIERKLYPNVDFYSGLIYEALNLPPDMFTVMFAIPRTSGWIAQWLEMVTDPETKIARPRQIYTGAREQSYVPIESREKRSEKPTGETNLIDPARKQKGSPAQRLDPEHGHEPLLVLGLDLGDHLHVLLDARSRAAWSRAARRSGRGPTSCSSRSGSGRPSRRPARSSRRRSRRPRPSGCSGGASRTGSASGRSPCRARRPRARCRPRSSSGRRRGGGRSPRGAPRR